MASESRRNENPTEEDKGVVKIYKKKGIIPKATLDLSIDELEFSIRTMGCLQSLNIKTIKDLINMETKNFLKCRNFGQKSIREIKKKLAELGLKLKGEK